MAVGDVEKCGIVLPSGMDGCFTARVQTWVLSVVVQEKEVEDDGWMRCIGLDWVGFWVGWNALTWHLVGGEGEERGCWWDGMGVF